MQKYSEGVKYHIKDEYLEVGNGMPRKEGLDSGVIKQILTKRQLSKVRKLSNTGV